MKHFKELRSKVTKNDRLLIYYSGHGYNEDELGYWIPVAAAKDEIGDYISNAEVRELIKAIDAKHILLISDSCFSASLLVRDASRDAHHAIEDWEKHDSRWVFISGKGVVSDGKKGENSPFAKAIIQQLEEVKEDALNVVRLADNVISSVRFNYEQQAELSPLFGAGHEGGQFIFRKEESESLSWQNAVNQDVAIAYYNFIEKYPGSKYQTDAFAKMQAAEDRDDWNNAKRLGGLSDFMSYLQKRPAGRFVAAAKTEIDRIRTNGSPKETTSAQSYAAPSPTVQLNRTVPRPQNASQVSDNQEDTGITPMKILKWAGYAVGGIFALFLLTAFFQGMYEAITEPKTESTIPVTTVTDTGNNTISESEKIGVNPKEQAQIPLEKKSEKESIPKQETVKGIDYTDVNDWNKANKSGEGTMEDYENYLKARPYGAFANHAKKRIEELKNKRQQRKK